ncbi:MAG: hypothetical protein KBC62_03485 [Candidatus Pacebacteria bacterium]|nr:hypothetical protein [Candidatus Paceibacterota bacterium]
MSYNLPTPTPSFATISSHNLINYFVPGVLFVHLLKNVTNYNFWPTDLLTSVIIYYIAGVVVNRFGSIYVKKFLRPLMISKEHPDKGIRYENYVNAKIADPEIKEIVQMSDLYKTILAIMILVPIIMFFEKIMSESATLYKYSELIIFLFFFLLFFKSYVAQDEYVEKRISNYVKNIKPNIDTGSKN